MGLVNLHGDAYSRSLIPIKEGGSMELWSTWQYIGSIVIAIDRSSFIIFAQSTLVWFGRSIEPY